MRLASVSADEPTCLSNARTADVSCCWLISPLPAELGLGAGDDIAKKTGTDETGRRRSGTTELQHTTKDRVASADSHRGQISLESKLKRRQLSRWSDRRAT